MVRTAASADVDEQRCDDREIVPKPRVSVIIPAFNVSCYIGETLESVLAQTFRDFEIIVVNDGSPDTPQLEEALTPYVPWIRYIRQANRGPGGARNTGISLAQGPFVAFLDGDDLWTPDFLAAQMAAFGRDSRLDLVWADSLLFGSTPLAGQTTMELGPAWETATAEALLDLRCTVLTSCVVARKASIELAGGFDEQFLRSEDFDLWVRMALQGARLVHKRRVLGRRRLHGGNLVANGPALLSSAIAVYRKLRSHPHLDQCLVSLVDGQITRFKAELALETGKQLLRDGEYCRAREQLLQANHQRNSSKLRLVLWGLAVAPRAVRLGARLWTAMLRNRTRLCGPSLGSNRGLVASAGASLARTTHRLHSGPAA